MRPMPMRAGNTRLSAAMRPGNRFTLIPDGQQFLARMLRAIEEARSYVLAEFYLVESGAVADAFIAELLRAAARGVPVCAIFDAFGARGLAERDRLRLRTGGVRLAFYNRFRWRALASFLRRDHRKLLLVDGTVGFTGGIGLMDAFSPAARPDSYWRDCMVEMSGPVLTDWHQLFAHTWQRCGMAALDVAAAPSAPVHPGESGRVVASAGPGRKELGRSVIGRIRRTRRRVWIATPYFWPSMRLRRALRRAARRGLDVRLIVAGAHTDGPRARSVSRFFYTRLLINGVVIYEYQPRFLHCKLALCDDWASIGSSNLDRWGALWNLDANQEVDSAAFAQQVERLFTQICEHSAVLREPGDVRHPWSAYLWRHVARVILSWSTRVASRLRR
jgi:cardiolipin synthase